MINQKKRNLGVEIIVDLVVRFKNFYLNVFIFLMKNDVRLLVEGEDRSWDVRVSGGQDKV